MCFLINAISYIFVIAFLMMMKISPRKIEVQDTNAYRKFKEGFTYTFGFIPIRYIILLLALVSLMGMPYTVLMPVFAKTILHGGSHTFGFMMGATGIGALTGALYMASRKNAAGLEKFIPWFAAIFGFGLILFSFSTNFILSMFLLLITGFGMMMQMTSSNTILQTIVDDDKRGRVMSFYTMAFMGTAPFGSLLAGALASKVGAPNTILIGGVACILGAVVFMRKLPEIRKSIRPIYIGLGILPEIATGLEVATELTNPPVE